VTDQDNKSEAGGRSDPVYREGCPVCEHTDPELERELRVFADLLLDIYIADHGRIDNRTHDRIDNNSQPPTIR
jgi:hypothetical protein